MKANSGENILDAIDVYWKEMKKQLPYDQTYQGTISRIDDLQKGQYTAVLEGGEVSVYSLDSSKEYSVGDEVYIKVPQGDFSQKKIIEGKLKSLGLSEEELRILRNNVVEQIGPIEEHAVSESQRLYVGQEPSEIRVVDNASNSNELEPYSSQAQFLKLSADFSTSFTEARSQGNYGLKISFYTNDGNETFYFDLADFNGNPYNFTKFATQEKIFSLEGRRTLLGLQEIVFFQEGFAGTEGSDYIFVKNIQFAFVAVSDVVDQEYYLTYEAPNGTIFRGNETPEVLSITPVLLKNGESIGSGYNYNLYQKDSTIVKDSIEYREEAGLGWKFIKTAETFTFEMGQETEGCVQIHQDRVQENFLVVIDYEGNIVRRELVLTNQEPTYTISLQHYFSNGLEFLEANVSPEANDYSYKWKIGDADSAETSYKLQITAFEGDSTTVSCEVSRTSSGLIGGAQYELRKPTSKEDFTVSFSGPKSILYDANNIIYDKAQRTITANIEWAEGCSMSNATLTWTSNLSEETSSGTSFTFTPRIALPKEEGVITLTIALSNGQSFDFPYSIDFLKTGEPGTNGTEYSCSIVPNGTNIWIFPNDSQNNTSVGFRAEVFKNGEAVEDNISYKWTGVNLWLNGTTGSAIQITNIVNSEKASYVKLEVKIADSPSLYSFYPVHTLYGGSRDELDVKLPNYIRYNSAGYCPVYSGSDSVIYSGDNLVSSSGIAIPDVYKLENKAKLLTYNNSNSSIVYRHTVVSYINTYGNEAINGWDGQSIELAPNGGTVLAPQIGAGTKNDGKFSGVVMGKDSSLGTTGLFGYQNGVNTFGLTEEGKAYFGKTGKGRIEFDGDATTIKGVSQNKNMTLTLTADNDTDNAIEVANANTFSVKYNGEMKATAGEIGGWTLGAASLTGGGTTLHSTNGITTNTLTIKGDDGELGKLGLITGSTSSGGGGITDTRNIGIKASNITYNGYTPSIVFETSNNIRLQVGANGAIFLTGKIFVRESEEDSYRELDLSRLPYVSG